MDEVRADRLIEKHSKNALLVIIQEWPQKRRYIEKPELIPSLEYLVMNCLTSVESWFLEPSISQTSRFHEPIFIFLEYISFS